jgi:hypothetical protein
VLPYRQMSPVVQKAARRRPAYVDVALPPVALRREYIISVRHEPRFSRAYLRVSRAIYDPGTLKLLRSAIEEMRNGTKTVEEVVNTVTWFDPNEPLAAKHWELLGSSLDRAFTKIIEDAGASEAGDQGWKIKLEVKKTFSPFSSAYVRLKTASLVQEISEQQRDLLREILIESFEERVRSETILKDIESTVGLLSRERKAVIKRRSLILEAGASAAVADKRADRYAKQLLSKRAKRIARTETVDAYSQGLDDSWQLAKDEGLIDDRMLQEWVELTASKRTCVICRGLGGQRVPVGQNFVSDIIGEVDRPPAHAHCRCTRILVQADPEDFEDANRSVLQARATLAGG